MSKCIGLKLPPEFLKGKGKKAACLGKIELNAEIQAELEKFFREKEALESIPDTKVYGCIC